MALLPDAGLAPLVQPPPAGGTGHSEQGGRDLVPANSGAQHQQDPLERRPVVCTLAARCLNRRGCTGISGASRVRSWSVKIASSTRASSKTLRSQTSDTPTYSELISKWCYGGGQVPGVVWDLCQTAPFGSMPKACVRRSMSRAKSSCRSPTLESNGWSGPHWPDGSRSACHVE